MGHRGQEKYSRRKIDKGLPWKRVIIDFKPDFIRKNTDPGSAAISSAVSQPISMKSDMVNLFGS